MSECQSEDETADSSFSSQFSSRQGLLSFSKQLPKITNYTIKMLLLVIKTKVWYFSDIPTLKMSTISYMFDSL